jgi:protein-disulfide isomerase
VRSDRDHVRGDPGAALVVVEYGDYQCMDCAAAHALYRRVERWVEDGRMAAVFRHFPLVDAHPLALRAAQAAEAAAAQGAFWEMHHVLMTLARDRHDRGDALRDEARHTIDLEHAARRVGLNLDRFRAAFDDPAVLERILLDLRAGIASGVNGTPTFYVNGLRAEVGGVDELLDRIAAAVEA